MDQFNFENLLVYKKALNFANDIFEKSRGWPKEHSFSLTDQIRRASLSVVLNLAEGSGRTTSEFKRFIAISRSSCHECVPIIEIACKQGIIDIKRKEEWRQEVIGISKILSKLKNSITHN